MKVEDLRKQALLYAISEKSEELADRLLDSNVTLPDIWSDFHITVNGAAICRVDHAFTGMSGLPCEYRSLHDSIKQRTKMKAVFPGAIVAIVEGTCPEKAHSHKAA
jgi:hypothetical protein